MLMAVLLLTILMSLIDQVTNGAIIVVVRMVCVVITGFAIVVVAMGAVFIGDVITDGGIICSCYCWWCHS